MTGEQGDGKPRRLRRTVRFDAQVLSRRIEETIDRQCALAARGRSDWTVAAGFDTHSPAGRAWVRQQVLAQLKAFCDAARPAGGLPLDALNEPADLEALVRVGQENARLGDTQPKLLLKVSAGHPVDLRIAVAALHFFRWALGRPSWGLLDIGATESDRLRVVQDIERALQVGRDVLPASVYECLRLRAREAASHQNILDDVQVHYSGLQVFTDRAGICRLQLVRHKRITPLRMSAFAGRLTPRMTYEWYEWQHVRGARLWIRRGPAAARAEAPLIEMPLRRVLDHDAGVFTIDVDPQAGTDLLRHLTLSPAGQADEVVELIWEEVLVFNAADRDILVWYSPVSRLRVSFDPDVTSRLWLQVGDSPGMLPSGQDWRLDRVLMPREVIAVRFRLRSMQASSVEDLGASGEWPLPVTGGDSGSGRSA